ncbi:hypothetical protein [Streptomyces sp. NPDC017260]|uniref:hypothetical protein n=1 Tax=unclassified Streptomyces TaxID=2593676 RepID=UPI003798231E
MRHPRPRDPDDRRAQRVQLTGAGPRGRHAPAGRRGPRYAVGPADWSPGEPRQLAGLFHRVADDFLGHAADEEPEGRSTLRTATA